jgi:hypothetical protein
LQLSGAVDAIVEVGANPVLCEPVTFTTGDSANCWAWLAMVCAVASKARIAVMPLFAAAMEPCVLAMSLISPLIALARLESPADRK